MSEKGFLSWNEAQLKEFINKLVEIGEQWEKQSVTDLLFDVQTAHNTNISYLYTKAVIMELERLNKKIEELVQAMKH